MWSPSAAFPYSTTLHLSPTRGFAFVILDGWDARLKEKDQDLASIDRRLNAPYNRRSWQRQRSRHFHPRFRGSATSAASTMQVEIKNGDLDYTLLESLAQTVVNDGRSANPLSPG